MKQYNAIRNNQEGIEEKKFCKTTSLFVSVT